MRQLRVKSNRCAWKYTNSTCQDDYSFSNEEKRSFEPGWFNETTQTYNSSIAQSFKYKSSDQLDTYVYMGDHHSYTGGGYVYEFRGRLAHLRSNLSELHRLGWIDHRTRAVIIQVNLYNPNAQLFTSVTFLAEFLSTGGIYPQSRFEPMNFYGKSLAKLAVIKLNSSSFHILLSTDLDHHLSGNDCLLHVDRISILLPIEMEIFYSTLVVN